MITIDYKALLGWYKTNYPNEYEECYTGLEYTTLDNIIKQIDKLNCIALNDIMKNRPALLGQIIQLSTASKIPLFHLWHFIQRDAIESSEK